VIVHLAAAAGDVDSLARWLGVISVVISATGLYVNFRRDQPRLKVRAGWRVRWYQIWWIHAGIGFKIYASSKGRPELQLVRGYWEVRRRDSRKLDKIESRSFERPGSDLADSPFPLTLPGLNTRTWGIKPPDWRDTWAADYVKMRYVVLLGNEKRVRSPWILYMNPRRDRGKGPRAIDRAAFPFLWRPVREILRTKAQTESHRARYKEARALEEKTRRARERSNLQPPP
jgi:hypothetical protein